jgi:predicted secreted Zn-dependent protease
MTPNALLPLSLAALLSFAPVAALASDWKATEVEKTYAISGETGPELYASIGEKGPMIGPTRTIAVTNYDLRWRRNYVPEGTSCRLVSAIPFLTITYTLPKPAKKLSGSAATLWGTFIDGIRAHEKVHGDHVKEMTQSILDTTVGMVVENDPQCRRIKEAVKQPILDAGLAYKAKNRAFEEAEMAKGGNVHQLILGLVNGR